MRRLFRIALLASLAVGLGGCGDAAKPVDPKSEGGPNPALKRVGQKQSTGTPGSGPGKGQDPKPKTGASVN